MTTLAKNCEKKTSLNQNYSLNVTPITIEAIFDPLTNFSTSIPSFLCLMKFDRD